MRQSISTSYINITKSLIAIIFASCNFRYQNANEKAKQHQYDKIQHYFYANVPSSHFGCFFIGLFQL
jgi:hypothetical protein